MVHPLQKPAAVLQVRRSSIASVRGALLDIESNNRSSSIINLPSGTITLGNDLPVAPNGGRTIQFIGNGSGKTISGNNAHHVFNIDYNAIGGTYVTISNLTMSNGHDSSDTYGGGAIIGGTDLTSPLDSISLTNCTIKNRTATYGSGGGGIIWYGGTLRMTNDTISNNSSIVTGGSGAEGGGVVFQGAGTVSITGCTFSGNSISSPINNANGGALFISATTVSITNSNFSNNTATSTGSTDAYGGAFAVNPANVTITRCSFLNNSATCTSTGKGYAGAIYSGGSATTTVSYSRFSGNTAKTAGNVVRADGGSVTANNNWWGVNTGPGGSDLSNNGATVTAAPYLMLRLVPSRSTISANDTTLLTADILLLSSGRTTVSSNLSGLPTFTSSFGSAVWDRSHLRQIMSTA